MSQDNFNVIDVETLMDECLITKKIYGRCKQQDCLKPVDINTPLTPANYMKIDSSLFGGKVDLTNDPATATSPLLNTPIAPGKTIAFDSTVNSISIVGSLSTEVKVVKIDAPGPFSLPGCYTVTIQYTFSYTINLNDATGTPIKVLVDGVSTTDIPAKTTYTKMISLEGGIVDPTTLIAVADTGSTPSSYTNDGKPFAYVQAIATPLVSKIGTYSVCTTTPTCPPPFEYHADVVIGLFTIIILYRITTLCVVSNGPVEICPCQPSISNDPCASFNQLVFPYNDFDPPYGKCCK